MNGAEAILRTLADCGVTACFSNPGTSEMQTVAAFDRVPQVRPVLCLFEGVATGAADGFARVAEAPASVLLHLGAGLANGGANLHNARRAGSPVVNIVGDHATYHRTHDAPLTSDIAGLARPLSTWVGSPETPDQAVALAAEAWSRSQGPTAGPATLILPADCAWSEAAGPAAAPARPVRPAVAGEAVEDAARRLHGAAKGALLLGSPACTERGLAAAARIAATGVRVLCDTFVSRLPRGAGRFAPDKMLYFGEMAVADLAGTDLLLLAGTKVPVAFFAYPDAPGVLLPDGCAAHTLAGPGEDAVAALEALADALGAPAWAAPAPDAPAALEPGPLTAYAVGASIARHMPEDAVVSDDAVTASLPVYHQTKGARPHDWLHLTGGAIGQGLPVAVGAAVARPGAKVLSLNGDGAAAYTLQALWTAAREKLDVTAVVFANGAYRILDIEFTRTRSGDAGPAARSLLDLGNPRMDWCALAQGFGVPAVRAETAEAFDAALARAMAEPGPHFIEAVVG